MRSRTIDYGLWTITNVTFCRSIVHSLWSIVLPILLSACSPKQLPPPPVSPPAQTPSPAQNFWPNQESIKVGLLLPLSGDYGRFGESVLNGISCAMGLYDPCTFDAEVPIQIVVKNSVEELIDQEKVSAVIGPLLSQEMAAVVSVAETKQVPLIALAPGKKGDGTGDFVFQHSLIPEREAAEIVKKSAAEGVKHFVIFYPQNRYGEEYKTLFTLAVNDTGGKIVAEKAYSSDVPDYSGLLGQLFQKIHSKKQIGLFIPDSFRQIVKVAEALDNLKIENAKLIGTSAWYHPKLLTYAFHSLEGALIASPFSLEDKQESTQTFREVFTKAYGDNPAWLEAAGFDAMRLIAQAAKAKGSGTPADVRDGLKAIKNFLGVAGDISWNGENISEWPLDFVTVKEGQFVLMGQ